MISRRFFLKATASSLLLPFNLAYSGEEISTDSIFFFVLLSGGADSLSMLIPYSDKDYYRLRPTISIKSSKYLPLNKDYAVNKLLKDTYYDWYKSGHAIFYPYGGQENNSRSHFLSQDTLQWGVNRQSDSGFLARLQSVKDLKAISFTPNPSKILSSNDKNSVNLDSNHIKLNLHLNEVRNNYTNLNDTFEYINKNKILIDKISKSDRESMNDMGLAGKIMKEGGFNLGYIELPLWDTHSNQSSRMDFLLKDLNAQLLSFRNSIGESLWSKTTMVVMSEFGRTVFENGNGSDHGYGGLISIFGGEVESSMIMSGWSGLSSNFIHENRELPVKDDYRDIIVKILKSKYNLSYEEALVVFPK